MIGGEFDWTDNGIENDEGEVDDATAVANAKASISGGGVGVDTTASDPSVGATQPGGRTGESASKVWKSVKVSAAIDRGECCRSSVTGKNSVAMHEGCGKDGEYPAVGGGIMNEGGVERASDGGEGGAGGESGKR